MLSASMASATSALWGALTTTVAVAHVVHDVAHDARKRTMKTSTEDDVEHQHHARATNRGEHEKKRDDFGPLLPNPLEYVGQERRDNSPYFLNIVCTSLRN